MISQAVTDLDAEKLLDSVELWAATQEQCEARVFVAAARFATCTTPTPLTTTRDGVVGCCRGWSSPNASVGRGRR